MPAARPPLPRFARALVPRELASWGLISVALAAVEGGVLGVLVKNVFAGSAPPLVVNIAVAAVSGAPAFANLASFIFAALSEGRDKIVWLSRLLALTALGLVPIALASRSLGGLLLLTAGAIVARVSWSGAITIRAAVWRANFPRPVRARITARMTTLSSLVIAAVSGLIGLTLEHSDWLFRPVWLLAAAIGLAGAGVYRRARVRGHRALLRDERRRHGGAALGRRLRRFADVLRHDREFRDYMIGMFVFGGGNLMVTAPLIVLLNEALGLARVEQVLVTSTVPLVALAFSVPFWARLLDRQHIIDYRARQSWFYVASIVAFAAGVMMGLSALLWLGGLLQGVAYAGGNLGWNLGHNDFSQDHDATTYMGVHVTLTGIRGLLMPPLGVLFYEGLEWLAPDAGRYALLLPLLLSTSGAAWFVHLHRRRR